MGPCSSEAIDRSMIDFTYHFAMTRPRRPVCPTRAAILHSDPEIRRKAVQHAYLFHEAAEMSTTMMMSSVLTFLLARECPEEAGPGQNPHSCLTGTADQGPNPEAGCPDHEGPSRA
jgi:hypothetical protein